MSGLCLLIKACTVAIFLFRIPNVWFNLLAGRTVIP